MCQKWDFMQNGIGWDKRRTGETGMCLSHLSHLSHPARTTPRATFRHAEKRGTVIKFADKNGHFYARTHPPTGGEKMGIFFTQMSGLTGGNFGGYNEGNAVKKIEGNRTS